MKTQKEFLYFTYYCSKDGKYAHPTIRVHHSWDGKPRWLGSQVMEITSQCHFTGENPDYGKPNTWVRPYAIRFIIEQDRANCIPNALIRHLMTSYTYKDVLLVLRKHKVFRWVKCGDNLVPRKYKKQADLFLQARENGFSLTKV